MTSVNVRVGQLGGLGGRVKFSFFALETTALRATMTLSEKVLLCNTCAKVLIM